jgi:hypothetical protein
MSRQDTSPTSMPVAETARASGERLAAAKGGRPAVLELRMSDSSWNLVTGLHVNMTVRQ